ncbi:MAG: M20/M25/M40 family metallo-hydrolase, partial [Nitrososphaerales archaeon]|nr:M20/M25/M40 family metallo-hydrolase [Nitrososphaerales archaeon]
IITEPTGLDSIWINSAGVLWFRLRVIGKSAHAGYAHLGVNAIGKALKIYEALIALDEYRAKKIHNPFVEKRSPGRSVHLNVGTIRGGDWPSTVAGWADLECRISFQYPERISEVKRQVEDQVRRAAELDPWMREHPPLVEWFGYSAEAATTSPDEPIFKTVAKIAKEIVGREPEAAGTTVANDLRHFILYGNMPNTILYGPGGSRPHGVDECVSIDDYILLTKILALTIIEWCGYTES